MADYRNRAEPYNRPYQGQTRGFGNYVSPSGIGPGAVAAPGNPNQGAPGPMTRWGDTIGSVNATGGNQMYPPPLPPNEHMNSPFVVSSPDQITPELKALLASMYGTTAPSPGLGSGVPAIGQYEDMSYGYPGTASPSSLHPQGAGNDPLLILLQMLINNRFPNGR